MESLRLNHYAESFIFLDGGGELTGVFYAPDVIDRLAVDPYLYPRQGVVCVGGRYRARYRHQSFIPGDNVLHELPEITAEEAEGGKFRLFSAAQRIGRAVRGRESVVFRDAPVFQDLSKAVAFFTIDNPVVFPEFYVMPGDAPGDAHGEADEGFRLGKAAVRVHIACAEGREVSVQGMKTCPVENGMAGVVQIHEDAAAFDALPGTDGLEPGIRVIHGQKREAVASAAVGFKDRLHGFFRCPAAHRGRPDGLP